MGDPIPHGEGAILRENVAAHCKVKEHSTVSCAKTAEPIDMSFWFKIRLGPRNRALDGVQIPKGKGQFRQFLGLSGLFKTIGNLR